MSRTTLSALGLTIAMATACASSPDKSPRERYYAALDAKLAGDTRAWQDGLIALAHEAPDTRAGRRARASLTGADMYTVAAVGGMIAAVAIPAFMKYQGRAKQSEAKTLLMQVQVSQFAYKQHRGTWCPDIKSCGLGPYDDTRYVYFLTKDVVLGGGRLGTEARNDLVARGRSALGALGLEPNTGPDGFLAVAVGDLDDDPDLDIWTIDDAGGPFQLANDIDGGDANQGLGPTFGL